MAINPQGKPQHEKTGSEIRKDLKLLCKNCNQELTFFSSEMAHPQPPEISFYLCRNCGRVITTKGAVSYLPFAI